MKPPPNQAYKKLQKLKQFNSWNSLAVFFPSLIALIYIYIYICVCVYLYVPWKSKTTKRPESVELLIINPY